MSDCADLSAQHNTRAHKMTRTHPVCACTHTHTHPHTYTHTRARTHHTPCPRFFGTFTHRHHHPPFPTSITAAPRKTQPLAVLPSLGGRSAGWFYVGGSRGLCGGVAVHAYVCICVCAAERESAREKRQERRLSDDARTRVCACVPSPSSSSPRVLSGFF